VNSKAAYVRSQGQTRAHHCHWPGCTLQVPPAKWGCKSHWFTLPPELRARIWATFKPGQEVNGTPSREYVAAAKAVQDWINERNAEQLEAAGQTRLF
jgi:hypothetical protein